MILLGQIKGIFKCFPTMSFDLKTLCEWTHKSKEEIEPIIKQLLKDGFVKGKRTFKLKNVPQHVKDIPCQK